MSLPSSPLMTAYHALTSDADRTRFRALGVLSADLQIDLSILAALWQTDDAAADAERLVAGTLLSVAEPGYRQEAETQALARSLLDDAEFDTIFARYADAMIDHVTRWADPNLTESQIAVLEPEVENISAIAEMLAIRYEKRGDYLIRKNRLSERLYKCRIRYPVNKKLIHYYTHMLAIHRAHHDQQHEAHSLHALAMSWMVLKDYTKTHEFYEQALAIAQAMENKGVEADILANMAVAFHEQNQFERAQESYEQALALHDFVDAGRLAHILTLAAWNWKAQDQLQKALVLYERALVLLETIDYKFLRAATLHNVGAISASQGKHLVAVDYYKRAVRLYESLEKTTHKAHALRLLGDSRVALGSHETAIESYQQAYEIVKDSDDHKLKLDYLWLIGETLAHTDHRQALTYFERARDLARAQHKPLEEANALQAIGDSLRALQEYDAALQHYEQALALKQTLDDKEGQYTLFSLLGLIWFEQKNYREALSYYERGLPLTRETQSKNDEAGYLVNMGISLQLLGEFQKAIECLDQVLTLSTDLPPEFSKGVILQLLAGNWRELGKHRMAATYYMQAYALLKDEDDKERRLFLMRQIGEGLMLSNDPERALMHLREALPLARALSQRVDEGHVLQGTGDCYSAMGRYKTAIEYYEQALSIRKALNDAKGQAQSLHQIGLAWQTQKNHRLALTYYEKALPFRRAAQDALNEGMTHSNAGFSWQALNEHQKAVAAFELALSIYQRFNKTIEEYSTAMLMATSLTALKRYQESITLYELHLGRMIDAGEHDREQYILQHLGLTWGLLNDHEAALNYFERLADRAHEYKNLFVEVLAYVEMGKAADTLGEYQAAIEAYDMSLDLNETWDELRLRALFEMSLTYEHMGALIRALECVEVCFRLKPDKKYEQRARALSQQIRAPHRTWWEQVGEQIRGILKL